MSLLESILNRNIENFVNQDERIGQLMTSYFIPLSIEKQFVKVLLMFHDVYTFETNFNHIKKRTVNAKWFQYSEYKIPSDLIIGFKKIDF